MEAKIRFQYFELESPKVRRLSSLFLEIEGEYNKILIYRELFSKIISGEFLSISINEIFKIKVLEIIPIVDEYQEVPTEMKEIPELQKINSNLSVLIERKFLDLQSGTRFWGKTKYGDYRLSVKVNQDAAKIFHTHEVYFPDPNKQVLTEKILTIFQTIKPSPERATKMATKKAADKTAPVKPSAVSPSKAGGKTTPVKKEDPKTKEKKEKPVKEKAVTKKSLVEGFMKKGLKAAEIVEAMEKNGTPSTLASVRAFMTAINAGE